jgi:hypothetical protein
LVPIASERGLAPRDRPLQPARWPPEGGCAAGAASCQDPRAPTRLGRARCWTPEGVRQEGAGASPRGCAVAFITCCRRAVKLRSVASDPRVGGARPALVQGSRGSSSPRPSLGSRAPRGASAWARGFGCFSGEKRGASTCCRCRPEGWRGERGFCRPPRGEVDAAFAFGLQRRIRPTLASSLHRRRVEPESLAVPPAEAGGSSGPCPVTHPATEVVGSTVAAEAGQAKASRQAGIGALGGTEVPRPRAEAFGRPGFGVRRPFC